MQTGKKRGRPPLERSHGAFKILEKDGIWILYHGESVRQTFTTKEKALEYLEWIKA